jgi:hypothetical protein
VGWFDDGSGLTASHPVGIFNTGGALLSSATVAASDPLIASVAPQPGAGFRYHSLASPLGLAVGTYRIGGLNPAGSSDKNYDFVPALTSATGVSYVHSYYEPGGALAYPNTLGDRERGYFGPNFQFELGGGPPPTPTVDLVPAISINLASDAQPGTNVGANPAGVVRSTNWNDFLLAKQTGAPLKNNAGATVPGLTLTTDETFAYPASAFDSGANFANPGDTALMRGHVYHGGNANVDVHVDGTIPYATYDVYVYYNSGGVPNTQTLSLLASDLSDLGITATVSEVPGVDSIFVESTNPTVNANYVKFSGRNNIDLPGFVLRAQNAGTPNSNQYGYINGIQIVSTVPEPSTFVLLVIGGAVFASRWRRRA